MGAYNPNLFSVTNILSGGLTNSARMATTRMATTTFAPSSSQIQAIGSGAAIPIPEPSAQMPTYALTQQSTAFAAPKSFIPSMTSVPPPPQTWHANSGIVTVNPLATIVQTPMGEVGMLNPGIGYTGLANTGLAPPTVTTQRAAIANTIDMTAPGAPATSTQPIQGNQIPNYYNIQNTPSLQALNSFVENVPHGVRQCDKETGEAAQELLQAQHRTGNLGPLGIQGVTSNEYLTGSGRRNLNMNRPPSNQVFPPLGIPGNGPKQPVVRSAWKNVRNHQYCPEMYMTPYDRTQNKIATGVLVNPYTSEVFQTFEEGMPLPQKNDSLLPSQFKQTNPKLVQLQGGIDYNAPLPSKQEIAENIPLINGGPNVWGDALYQPQLRQWFDQRAVMDQWNNRNGILPNYNNYKEHPAGFIGPDVNYLRPVPYNPATMRSSSTNDLRDWTIGVMDAPNENRSSMDVYNVIDPAFNNLDPNRGQVQTFSNAVGIVKGHGEQLGLHVIEYDSEASFEDLKATQKTLQENPVPMHNVVPEELEGYIYNPPDLKATQKVEADTFPFVRVGQNAQVQEGSVYQMAQDTDLRATSKAAFQVPVPIHNVSPDLPHTEIDLTAPSEKTWTRRQYYSDQGFRGVSNVQGEVFTAGVEGPQPFAEWTRVSKRGGTSAQTFRVVPNRVTDSLSNQGNFSPGCSDRDVYPEQPDAYMMYGSFARPSYGDFNGSHQTDFSASLPRPLPATSHCFKKGDGLEQDVSRYTLQAMPLSMVGQI